MTLGRDGSCPTQITRSLVSELGPAWRPGSVPGPSNCTAGVGPASLREGPSFDASSSALSLAGVRAFRAFPLLWPGARMPGYALTGVTRTAQALTFVYDCSIDRATCPRGLTIAIYPRRPRLGCARPARGTPCASACAASTPTASAAGRRCRPGASSPS